MATARPFAYNPPPNAVISGTIQVGDLAIGTPTSGFTSNPQFWNGPDEELGYVIAKPISGNTQPTPLFNGAPSSQLTLSSTYRGSDINLSNGNQTAYQQFGYQQSVLGQTFLENNDKVMYSVVCSLIAPLTLPNSHYVGFGTTSMNYQGNPYGGFPGNDNQSIGFSSGGEYWFNGAIQASGLPTWTSGDTIDVAVDLTNNKVWVRVNGGNWNNNSGENPVTGTGSLGISGLTSFYPALCPGYEGTMTIQNTATYGVPSGYTLLGTNITASVGFLGTKNMSNPLSEVTFVELTNSSFNQNFTTGNDASTWLTNNGYWNSWVSITPTPTATLGLTPTPSVTTTSTPTPTPTPTSGASGNFNVTISQVGPDVVWNGSGSFNLAALTSAGPSNMSGGYSSAAGVWAIGPNASVDTYSGTISNPGAFGTSSIGVTSNAGSTFGILPGGSGRSLYVPSGYVSNTNISGSSTYTNKTIAEAGLTPGTYTWSWGTGGNTSTLVMTISS